MPHLGDLYIKCKKLLMLKGLFEEDDEYLDDSYSAINTFRNQDTEDMFDDKRHFIKKYSRLSPRFKSSEKCQLRINGGRYQKHYINTLQATPGNGIQLADRIKSVKNAGNCCWKVFR